VQLGLLCRPRDYADLGAGAAAWVMTPGAAESA